MHPWNMCLCLYVLKTVGVCASTLIHGETEGDQRSYPVIELPALPSLTSWYLVPSVLWPTSGQCCQWYPPMSLTHIISHCVHRLDWVSLSVSFSSHLYNQETFWCLLLFLVLPFLPAAQSYSVLSSGLFNFNLGALTKAPYLPPPRLLSKSEWFVWKRL